MRLNELPGYHIANGELGAVYTEELRAIEEPGALYDLVRRWSALWEIGRDRVPEVAHPMLDRIVGCKFDAEEALNCINQCRASACEHVNQGGGESCPGMNIAMPPSLLLAHMVSGKFGVPICAALHQLFCDDANHLGCF